MREILFRGKRTDNGEWVEGFLIGLLDPTKEENIYSHWLIHNGVNISSGVKVHPESIGQFTGLLDINKRKIFEGDVVLHWVSRYPQNKLKGIVMYKDACAAFQYAYTAIFNNSARDFMHKPHFFDIIGNIHDNKEFLDL